MTEYEFNQRFYNFEVDGNATVKAETICPRNSVIFALSVKLPADGGFELIGQGGMYYRYFLTGDALHIGELFMPVRVHDELRFEIKNTGKGNAVIGVGYAAEKGATDAES